jgi:hypothetical protein
MPPNQNKIIVDINVYFRLAQSIRPLLQEPFGPNKYCLYVLPELTEEYNKSPRLKNSFSWFTNNEYVKNRECKWYLNKNQKTDIIETFKFIRDTSVDIAPDVSRVDIKCLAYAYILKIPVATDDSGMIKLAEEFDIKIFKLLEILKLMLDNNHIEMKKIREIAAYLKYLPDLPKNFTIDYKQIFQEDSP